MIRSTEEKFGARARWRAASDEAIRPHILFQDDRAQPQPKFPIPSSVGRRTYLRQRALLQGSGKG